MALRKRGRSLAARQAAELESWRLSEGQREPLHYLVSKLGQTPILFDLVGRYGDVFEHATDALELGAGQGWASCVIKHMYPGLRVTATDISPDAIARIGMWERVFDVHVDDAHAANAYDTGLPDQSVDLVFAFASAHHFVLQQRTLREIARVLRPGGVALYLYEPSCPDYLYPIAAWRVRRTRSDVVEDTLKRQAMAGCAARAGLECRLDLYPSTAGRGPIGTIYNVVLGAVPPLRRFLWCGANFKFTKR